jgi:glycosyltransferase involved in cell wall biosynthesis
MMKVKNENKGITFIIPTLNEEKHIGNVINTIKKYCKAHLIAQIVIVDNGSSDATKEIAVSKGAEVLEKHNCSIAALRNFGARNAKGDILIFLDADIYLTKEWGQNIEQVIEHINNDMKIITGSVCGFSHEPSWIEKSWWGPKLKKKDVKYINSGHFILHNKIFHEIGGFNEDLRTGEDPEFCKRAKNFGVKISNNASLRVMHEGYPKTIRQFFMRERWHGSGVFISLKDTINSKPTILSILQFSVLCLCIVFSLIVKDIWPIIIYLIIFLFLCLAASYYRLRKINKHFYLSAILFATLFIARSFSFLDLARNILFKKNIDSHPSRS